MILSAVYVEYRRPQRMQSCTWYVGDLSAQTSNNLEGQAFELVQKLVFFKFLRLFGTLCSSSDLQTRGTGF